MRPRLLPFSSGSEFTPEVLPEPPSPSLPRSEGLNRCERNVLIF